MEPISILLALAGVLRICMKAAALIRNHTEKIKQVSESMRSVKTEFDSLHGILVTLDQSLKLPSLQGSVNSEYVRQHWQYLEKSLKDCQQTLKRLNAILEGNKDGGPSAGNQIALDASLGMMTTLKHEIAVYRQTVGLSLNLIIVYVLRLRELTCYSHSVLMTEKQNSDMSSRLDLLTIKIQNLTQLLCAHPRNVFEEVDLDPAVIQNLKSCVISGGLVVSEEFSSKLTEQQKARVEECLSNAPELPLAPQSTQLSGKEVAQDEVDLETYLRVVQRFIETVTLQINDGQYAEAYVLLDTILTKTETILGAKHVRTLEMMEMLAVCHCQLERWDAARDIMMRLLKEELETSKHQQDVMHALAEDCLRKNEFREAENWCCRAMRGRRESLGEQHALYYKSVTLLVEILEVQGKQVEADGYKILVHSHSAIHDLVSQGNERAVRTLLNKVSKEDRDTALIIAVYNGHEKIVQLLLENGADANAKEVDDEPALIMAAKKGYSGVVRLLLVAGANIEAKDMYGETALLLGARYGHEDVIQLLLEKRADTDATNHYGLTALKIAERYKHEALVRLLKKQNPPWYQFKEGGHRQNQTRGHHNQHSRQLDVGKWMERLVMLEDVVESNDKENNDSDPNFNLDFLNQ